MFRGVDKFIELLQRERDNLTQEMEKEKQSREAAAQSAYINWLTKKYRQRLLDKQQRL